MVDSTWRGASIDKGFKLGKGTTRSSKITKRS